jgi:hypothetical protein
MRLVEQYQMLVVVLIPLLVVATVGPEKNCEFTYFEQDLVVK